jgi:hypothetical protein
MRSYINTLLTQPPPPDAGWSPVQSMLVRGGQHVWHGMIQVRQRPVCAPYNLTPATPVCRLRVPGKQPGYLEGCHLPWQHCM